MDLPESIPDQFTLLAVVDDDGTGAGIVEELNEFNNEFSIEVEFGSYQISIPLPPLTECDTGLEIAIFNLFDEELLAAITANSSGTVSFFMQLEDAIANENAIVNPGEFENTSNPQTIYVRLENEICFTTASFQLIVEKCLPSFLMVFHQTEMDWMTISKLTISWMYFPTFCASHLQPWR